MSARLLPGRPFLGMTQAAGVHDLEEAQAVAAADFDLLGIPLRLPVHKPDLSEAQARELIAALPDTLTPVCITYESDADELLALLRFLGCRHVQLHAARRVDQDALLLQELKRRDPELIIIKSLVVGLREERELAEQVRGLAPFADAFITDTFDPQSGASGATGQVHDWGVSRRLRELSPRPLILAGGLTAENVAAAIRQVRPAGVDAHTGLEGADGRKDMQKMLAFVQATRGAFAAL